MHDREFANNDVNVLLMPVKIEYNINKNCYFFFIYYHYYMTKNERKSLLLDFFIKSNILYIYINNFNNFSTKRNDDVV